MGPSLYKIMSYETQLFDEWELFYHIDELFYDFRATTFLIIYKLLLQLRLCPLSTYNWQIHWNVHNEGF